MCYCLKMSKNAYYNWLKNKDVVNINISKIHLMSRIADIFKDSKEVYGSHRIQKMLEREDLFYSRSYVAVLMKKLGLRSVLKRKFVITTKSDHSYPIAKNVLNRDFGSQTIGEKWVSGITYIRVKDDWNYLTTIMDLADRKIVGWSLTQLENISLKISPAQNILYLLITVNQFDTTYNDFNKNSKYL